MSDAPVASWLHIGPNSAATVTVTFPGTHKAFSLTREQMQRVRQAFERAEAIIAEDDGERDRRLSINLMEGVSP